MIRKGRENIKAEKISGSHGGNGTCMVRTLLTDEFGSSLSYVREIKLHPYSTIGVHPHHGDEEIYYIISGRGVMNVNGEEEEVGPGDIVLVKSGSTHGLRNDVGEDLLLFVACAKL